MIVDEPLHTALEAGQTVDDFRLESFDGEERNQADHGTDFEVVLLAVRKMQQVVVKAVFFVPERYAVGAEVIHGVSDVHEVFEELAGDVFVSGIFFREFEGDGEHVEAIHAHPAGSVGLLEVAACRKGRGAVEYSDVIEPQEAALKDIRALGIFPIDPPGEVEKQFVKNFFKESAVADATDAPFDFVNTPGGPSVDGGIYVTERPFVRRELAVRVHVPFAKKEN